MAKKNTTETVAQDNNQLATVDNTALLAQDGRIDTTLLFKSLGLDASQWVMDEGAPAHYHVPEANSYVVGTYIRNFTYTKTQYGEMKCAVIELTKPCVGHSIETGEPEMLQPGDLISVNINRGGLETKLADKVGEQVVMICDGKIPTKDKKKEFTLYRVGVLKSDAAE